MENSNVNNTANDSNVEMGSDTVMPDMIATEDVATSEVPSDVKDEVAEAVVTNDPIEESAAIPDEGEKEEAIHTTEAPKVGFENKDNMYAQTQQRTYYTYPQGQSTTGAQVNRTAFDVSANVTNSKATASLVLGIIALISNCICCCLPVSLILSVISLILSISSKKKDPNNKMNGKAIAGLVCSIVAIVAYIITLIVVILSITSTILDPEFQNELNAMLSEYGYEIVF